MEKEKEIYQSEVVKLIYPLKARVFSDKWQRIESYQENGEKIILFTLKENAE